MMNRGNFSLPPLPLLAVVLLSSLFISSCQQLEGFSLLEGLEPRTAAEETEADPVTAASPEPDQLKIGALLPYTGNLAGLGQPMIEALPLIVDKVNSCGGVNNESVALIVEDDRSQPDSAVTAMNQLIDTSQIDVAVVGFVGGNAPAILDLSVQNKIPTISPASTSPIFTERAKQGDFQGYWARTVPSHIYQAHAMAKMAIDRRYRTASLIVVNNDDGISFEQAFTEKFQALGGTVLSAAFPPRYDPTDTNQGYAALDAFRPSGQIPDVVVAFLGTQGGVPLFQSAYEFGITDKIQTILSGYIQPQQFLEAVGKGYDGKYILTNATGLVPGSTDGATLDELTSLWQKTDSGSLGVFVPHTWDAVALLVLAAQAAKSNEGEEIQKYLQTVANPPGEEVTDVCAGLKLLTDGRDIDYQGASGFVNLDKNGDVVGNYNIWSVTDQGKIEVTEQLEVAP